MTDIDGLQALIDEYGRLRRLEDHTAQSRGQRFNGLIAEMLQCFGIDARPSQQSKGEIDVGFALGGTRYVLEAKWEQKASDTGHIAKLQKRVRQRMAGTVGIFLSMAGYSGDALSDLTDGERLEVLLLDADHFEAMLSGLVPPEELLELARDHASYFGAGYAPLAALLDRGKALPKVEFDTASAFPDGLVAGEPYRGEAEVLFTLPDSGQLGVAAVGGAEVLVTTGDGIVRVDLTSRSVRWAVPVAACHRNPVVYDDGAIVFTRRDGVGRYLDGRVTVLGGGVPGNSCLMPHPDGRLWAFSNGDINGQPGTSITRLGDSLGDEVRYPIDYPPAAGFTSAWVNETDVLTTGPTFLITSVEAGTGRRFDIQQANPMGLAVLDDGTVLTAGDSTTLIRTDLQTKKSVVLAQLNLLASVNELCLDGAGGLCVGAYFGGGPGLPIAVARLPLAALLDGQSPDHPAASNSAADVVGPVAESQVEATEDREPNAGRGGQSAPASSPAPELSVRSRAPEVMPHPLKWRIVNGGLETAGLSNGLKDLVGPHAASNTGTSPSVRVGVAIAADALPLTGLETRQIRQLLLELLNTSEVAMFTAAAMPGLPTAGWQSYGNGGRTRYVAVLSHAASVGDEQPLAWMRLNLPQPAEPSFGLDNRCVNFVLHIDWRSPDGAGRDPFRIEDWQGLMRRALSLPAALTGFITRELQLSAGEDPPTKIGLWLNAPDNSDLSSLVHLDGLPRLPGSQLSRWYDAYAIADRAGVTSDDLVIGWMMQLRDEYLHLD